MFRRVGRLEKIFQKNIKKSLRLFENEGGKGVGGGVGGGGGGGGKCPLKTMIWSDTV